MRSNYCLQDVSGAFRPNPCLHGRVPYGTRMRPRLLPPGKLDGAELPYRHGSESQSLRIQTEVNPSLNPGAGATTEAFREGRREGAHTKVSVKASRNSSESYFRQIRQFPLLSQEEEFGLAVRYKKESDVGAAQKLIESNLRFVVRVALEFRSYGIKITDLIQEGNIGLIMALKKFDPYRGYRFITYAVWWVRACIQNFIMKNWSLVKIGTTQAEKKLFYRIGEVRKALEADQEEEKKYEILAKDFDVNKEDIIEMEQRMSSRDFSLDSPLDGAQELTHYDLLQENSADQEELLGEDEEKRILQKEIRDAMRQLSEKEEYILRNRTMADFPLTLREIGDHLKLSRERVRQIESQAMRKLKQELTPRIHLQS